MPDSLLENPSAEKMYYSRLTDAQLKQRLDIARQTMRTADAEVQRCNAEMRRRRVGGDAA